MAISDQQTTISPPLVWRVNVRTRTCTREPVPESWLRLGGRGLVARILVDEVPATCEPLGPYNKLLFCPGLLVGHMLSACDRLSIGGKSPLTGGVKEANAGGTTGLQMVYLGIKALIIEDMPAEPGWWVLHLSAHGARFDKAEDGGSEHGVVGLGVHDAAHRLLEKYGSNVALSLIGQGGEMKLCAAGIQNLDKEHRPSRIAARGGLTTGEAVHARTGVAPLQLAIQHSAFLSECTRGKQDQKNRGQTPIFLFLSAQEINRTLPAFPLDEDAPDCRSVRGELICTGLLGR